jgi:hypothetical protein
MRSGSTLPQISPDLSCCQCSIGSGKNDLIESNFEVADRKNARMGCASYLIWHQIVILHFEIWSEIVEYSVAQAFEQPLFQY